jgi:hypothetical protein
VSLSFCEVLFSFFLFILLCLVIAYAVYLIQSGATYNAAQSDQQQEVRLKRVSKFVQPLPNVLPEGEDHQAGLLLGTHEIVFRYNLRYG